MSSKFVRETVQAHFAANWTDTPYHVIDDIDDVESIPTNDSEPWVGIEYVAATEQVNCLPANLWDERGTIFFHIAIPNGYPSSLAIDLGEKLRKSLRGVRIGTLVIESVSPPISQSPPAIEWDSPWQGFALICSYQSIRT
jgi:hypothetical protein